MIYNIALFFVSSERSLVISRVDKPQCMSTRQIPCCSSVKIRLVKIYFLNIHLYLTTLVSCSKHLTTFSSVFLQLSTNVNESRFTGI